MKRPKIDIKLDPIDRVLQATTALGLLALVLLPLYYFDMLPDEIPSHFGPNGQPDDYSRKGIIWTLPIIGLLLSTGLFWLNKHPHTFNYPQKITEDNAERLYTVATKVTRFINAQMALVFAYLAYSTIHTALGTQDGLSPYFLVIFIICNFVVIGYLLYKSTQK